MAGLKDGTDFSRGTFLLVLGTFFIEFLHYLGKIKFFFKILTLTLTLTLTLLSILCSSTFFLADLIYFDAPGSQV